MKFSLLLVFLANVFGVNYQVSDSTFTDSQGQTAKYRIGIPDDYVSGTPAKILIHFHGNNSGTQDDMLNMWYRTTENKADARNLIPIVVASPGTRSDGVTRQWDEKKDPLMLHELIQSNFQNKITVDNQGLYLWGASQGTCFINAFLLNEGDKYLGGALGNCGCFNYLNPTFQPNQDFLQNFRFYILATTGDGLHSASTRGYEYYKWTVGMKQIRGNLDLEGAHCTAPNEVIDSALDWMTGTLELPENEDKIHWQRVNALDSIQSLAIGGNNQLLLGVQSTNDSEVFLSEDQGDTWTKIITIPDEELKDIVGTTNNEILVLTESTYYRFDSSHTEVERSVLSFDTFIKSKDDAIYRISVIQGIEISNDQGLTWELLFSESATKASIGKNFKDTTTFELVVNIGWKNYIVIDDKGRQDSLTLPTENLGSISISQYQGEILLFGIDYNNNYKPYAWTTQDHGLNWNSVTLPVDFTIGYNGYGIGYFYDGRLLYHGSSMAQLSPDNGSTWVSEKNLSKLGHPILIQDLDGIAYATDGTSLMRYQTWTNSKSRVEHTTVLPKDKLVSLNNFQYPLGARVMESTITVEAWERISIYSISMDGKNTLLYHGNPRGVKTLSLKEFVKNQKIQIKNNDGDFVTLSR
jgi:hypothetical protein